ncbi:MAG TPA: extracellular solute-binding protein [Solirubrobacteraceae bacterium]|nr:extracellular solute-binding protein [Solirubrobacteraceae bacterium]
MASTGGAQAAAKGCSANATVLTFWGWSAGYNLAVDKFNATHPSICVKLENAGATTDEYTKLSDALKAKSGTPDLAQIEYFELPSFEITHSLVNLAQYGIESAKAHEAPAAWKEVSQGSAVYAMPVDLGSMALYYNSKVFAAHGIQVPRTWAQFATAAAKLHKSNRTAAITNFDPESTQDVLALMEEFDAFPFTYTGGSTLGIHFTGAASMGFANYWQSLISKKEVTLAADFSPAQWADFSDEAAASRLSPAWGPVGMQLSIKKTLGDWRAAPLPQVKAGADYAGNWGGSTVAVIAGTAHAKQAEEFARWFGGSEASWKILSGPVGGAFPGYLPLLNSKAFQDTKLKISGNSTYNSVFASAAKHVVAADWPPIMTAALTQWTTTFAGVVTGNETLPQAFKKFQAQMVKYAQAQGFKVTTG